MIDLSKYTKLEDIERDIVSVTIQGATNVAIATVHGLILHCSSVTYTSSVDFYSDIEKVGNRLANLRRNEPLAKNAVKYILYMLKTNHGDADSPDKRRDAFLEVANAYLDLIQSAKKKIIEIGKRELKDIDGVFTHCHSSTAEDLIAGVSEGVKDFKVVCTETRPLFQGRITATNLLKKGLDTTLIADSAAESYIIGRGNFPVDVVFIGADQISINGDVVNKVGSWGIALAAYFANIPIYVVTPFLKVDADSAYTPTIVEKRDPKEIWDSAPEGLKMDNPAFDIIDSQLITGYITELGLVLPTDVASLLREHYRWAF